MRAGRLIFVRINGLFTFGLAVLVAGCGAQDGEAADERSGLTGQVHLGPQCPVETNDQPCKDAPAVGVTVTVARQLPGDSYTAGQVVVRTTTDSEGNFRVAVAPGTYVVTSDAGMSCELMDARVTTDAYSRVDIPCDTGIR